MDVKQDFRSFLKKLLKSCTIDTYTPDHVDREGYTLRLVDAKTGTERILLESKTGCYLAKEWKDNNVLVIEYDDENYNRALMEYDLNSNTIINAPASPAP